MGLEQKINYQLNKCPKIKKTVKSIYQHLMYAVSPKIKSEGNIVRISPDDSDHEYFFGYYDKSPWDITDRYMLCLKANDTWSDVSPKEKADILLIDTDKKDSDPERIKKLAETNAWNVQQSCMMQWMGPDYSSRILYNDFRNGAYCSVILTLSTMEERIIPAPVYSVSSDGKFALTLDFSRLYELRPGYGYNNLPEETKGIALPDTTAIWKVDLETGDVVELLKYTDFASFQPREEMNEVGSVHKVNHIMISPDNKRFMVLYRWFIGERKYTRLITCDVDGTNMFVLSDDDMVSHCFWKDSKYIIAFENKSKGGTGYYLMKDKTDKFYRCWPEMTGDGHPSFSPDRKLIVTDTYPNRSRIACVKLMDGDVRKREVNTIAKVFAPFKYDNDTRCDLHPRWNREGNKICFDSIFEGHRGLYTINVPESWIMNKSTSSENSTDDTDMVKFSIITPMYNSFELMSKYFRSFIKQTYKNFEIIIVDDCSTDDSYSKLIDYAAKSKLDIKVAKSDENAGPGNARNIGMQLASGEWMTFIDSDDWVSEVFLEKINDVVRKEDTNCVIYDLNVQTAKNNSISRSVYGEHESGNMSVEECIPLVRNHVVGKVYKIDNCREKNIQFPKQRRCEDVAFVCRAIEACGSAFYLKEPLYFYFQRAESLSNNQNLAEEDMVKAYIILRKELGEKYPKELCAKSIPDLLYGGVLMMSKSSKSNREIRQYIKDYEKVYPNWYKNDMVNKLGKAKKIYLMCIRYKLIIGIRLFTLVHSLMLRG